MATGTKAHLEEAESCLRSAQSETDTSRRTQFAQAAMDSAAEVAWDTGASVEDRSNARAIMRTSLKLRVETVHSRRIGRGRSADGREIQID
ncbi:hypothetical protein AFM11_30055 [Mycolicibacterium wolinskyi]|uniref:Uncharacterized protein n=1 Tax=Mycolicibacterium wolinskyi TaxID=59750 RepID=A0A132PDM6_9MYCO|nr:hypothetical protein [Mycolicibacterium wolinskyi]KWX20433.1 hypothetical protein AFM11_30055 [Mycolicibacterium wolinskyi]